uniref:DUF2798 domain-containing protein n=1 Tax=Thaumasiovibrio occultus TaxID=1891184 RepID=UPI000B3550B0|nr:DUF2798 domain-containing protein [Thaumasiovibrio occultus]
MTRTQFWTTAILSSLTMALCMSGVLTSINTGIDSEWHLRWARSFSMAWPVALTMNILVLPKIRQLAAHIAAKIDRQPLS